LSNSSGVIGDWAVSINGKGDWKGSEHTESGKSDTVHTSVGESESNGDSDANNWNNNGNVTESKSKNNIWCGPLSQASARWRVGPQALLV